MGHLVEYVCTVLEPMAIQCWMCEAQQFVYTTYDLRFVVSCVGLEAIWVPGG